ncbi:MAG: ribosome-associated translation inhibitor RaiA [Chlamydiota bacterium]|nr:ribosome-associated translation inhibitor RaiA [Chlamydiota bacterium]
MSRKSKAEEYVDDGYNINVVGRNVLITDAMKAHAMDKMSKIEKFATKIIDVTIKMDIQKLDHVVDIVMKVDHVKIKSSATTDDMYASIDLATDKLQRNLMKYKKRIQEHTAKPLSVIDMNVNVISEGGLEEINDEIESENSRQMLNSFGEHKIVSNEKRPLKQLTVNEAIMKLDLSGDNFMIYRSEEDQKLKVIYDRNDGDFGIIEIEG